MKLFFILFICVLLFSCSSTSKKEVPKENECAEYACPMHPDKTSAFQEECPECRMKMESPLREKQIKDTVKVDDGGEKE